MRIIFLVLTMLLIVIAWFIIGNKKISAPSTANSTAVTENTTEQPDKPKVIKKFTAEEFRDLYNNFAYPNTQAISEESPITGDDAADKRIRALAHKRGYKIRSAPVTNTFVEVEPNMRLQRLAAESWKQLTDAAKADRIALSLGDAYRAADDQKSIFLTRLGSISLKGIANGSADKQVDVVLQKTAPPGYSRHHTGYTVDIKCDNQPNIVFEKSVCFSWLSQNNYLNAKKAGWIPSYPEGTGAQGPEPESWEYVWVGTNAVYE